MKKKYSAYDLVLKIVIHALIMLWHYFLGKIFILMTYHISLTNYFKHPTINSQHEHRVACLSEFEFELKI